MAFKIICVTNRSLVVDSFIEHIKRLAAARPDVIVLREKDLDVCDYTALAGEVLSVCKTYNVQCFLHTHAHLASELGVPVVLPMEKLTAAEGEFLASCHSVDDANKARALGASGIIVGHIFDTDCKKNVPGRGLRFLNDVVKNSDIPVYAIGGITSANIRQIIDQGASGACVMSGAMQCKDADEYIRSLRS